MNLACKFHSENSELKRNLCHLMLRIVFDSLFVARRWYGGRTAAMLRHLAFQTIWVTNFLFACMYVFAYTRTIITATASYKYFTRICDDGLADGLPFFLADPACYLRFPKMPTKLSDCREIYSRQSEIVTKCIRTIKYFEYWLLTGIEISAFRKRPHEVSRGAKYIARYCRIMFAI